MELLTTDVEALYEAYDFIDEIKDIDASDSDVDVEAFEIVDGEKETLPYSVSLKEISLSEDSLVVAPDNAIITSNLYLITATSTTKTSSDTLTKEGVTLSGSILWVDNAGIANEFLSASGSRKGSTSGSGYYAAYRRYTPLCSGYFDSSFYAKSDLDDSTGTQFQLIVRSDSTTGNQVQLSVKTSIFD